jgi:hypothetical protein
LGYFALSRVSKNPNTQPNISLVKKETDSRIAEFSANQINLKACIPWATQSDYNYLASCQRDYINWLISTAHGMGMNRSVAMATNGCNGCNGCNNCGVRMRRGGDVGWKLNLQFGYFCLDLVPILLEFSKTRWISVFLPRRTK